MLRIPLAILLIASLPAAGCTGAPESTDPPYASVPPSSPDTTAAGLWAHVESADYRQWPLWPGKGELYPGAEPHGMLLTTHLNALAHDALTGRASAMPPGAVIVKENYTPDSTLAAITIMYKAPGYAPDHGDWFWMKRGADGAVEASGRVQSCIECHGSRMDNDYIQTSALTEG